ncbi:MAG TPA: hypothetical protein V6D22_12160 [Candidatus Obscuribacterales bacterium]
MLNRLSDSIAFGTGTAANITQPLSMVKSPLRISDIPSTMGTGIISPRPNSAHSSFGTPVAQSHYGEVDGRTSPASEEDTQALHGSLPVNPLKLEVYEGAMHTYAAIEQANAIIRQGVQSNRLKGRSSDNGTVIYDRSGNVSAWTSVSGDVTRKFTYTDLPSQLNQIPVPGLPVTSDNEGHLWQIVSGQAGMRVVAVQRKDFDAAHRIDQVLTKVEDNQNRIWTRDQNTGLMQEFQTTGDGHLQAIGTFLTDAQLIPRTILNPDVAQLYATPNDSAKSIGAYGINQGLIADCYFESTLASLAQQRPEAIKSMVKDNHDGTFTVNFPRTPNVAAIIKQHTAKGKAFPQIEPGISVRIEAPTQVEIETFNHTRWELPTFAKLPPELKNQAPGPSVCYAQRICARFKAA